MDKGLRFRPLLLPILSAALAALLLFAFLYRYNNKYTAPGTQPISGLLVLGETALDTTAIHYLIREWECYPGVLLSPSDFTERGVGSYRQYVSIGQYGGMELGNPQRPPHGSASYRLTLDLPAQPRQYSLHLPTIFSAYHLYINDTLALTVGTPELASYSPRLQTRSLSFQAGGRVQLLFAVTDLSWVYSGLVYPPALGLPEAIERWSLLELSLRATLSALTVLALFLSLYAAIRAKWKPGLLFAATVLCFYVYLIQPFFTRFATITSQLPNALFLFSFYAMLCFAVQVHCSLCDISRNLRRVAFLVFGLGALAALGIGALAPLLTLRSLHFFSIFVGILKLLAALTLLIVSTYGVQKEIPTAKLLLFSSIFFPAALLFDRLYPLYEPIYGGWFPEIGGIVLVASMTLAIWSRMSHAYRFELTYNEYMRQATRQLTMQATHYHQLSEQMAAVRIARHDLRHHMRLLQRLAEQGDLTALQGYLQQYRPPVGVDSIEAFTGHSLVDALLAHYAYQAKLNSIRFDTKANLPPTLSIPDEQLCILLGNLLENALDACLPLPAAQRHIYLRLQALDGSLRLVLDNSFSPATRKTSGQGLGLQSVQRMVARYSGLISAEQVGALYQVSVMLPSAVSDATTEELF